LSEPQHKDDPALSVDMQQAWAVLMKRKWVIAAVTVCVVAATLAYNVRQTPVYSAACSVVIEPAAPRVLSNVEEVVPTGAGSFWSNTDFYETEYKILQSRALAEIVAEKLGLDKDKEFAGHAAESVLARVTISPVKSSKMVLIEYRDTNPRRAAELANAHARAYSEYNLRRKLEGTKTAAEWLSQQLGDLKGKLESSEMSLYTFKKENNVLAQSLDDRVELLKKTIEDRARELQALQSKRIALKARIDEIDRAKGDPNLREALPDVINNPNVQELTRLRLELDTQLVQLSVRYGEKYPKYDETQKQRAAIDQKLQAEIDKIIAAIESEHRIAQDTERSLEAELRRAALESLELNKLSVDHNKLKRESDNINRLYGVVISRLKETDLTQLLNSNNVRIIDDATVPGAPIFPRTRNNVALSVVAGLLLGVALAFLLNYFDSSVKTQEDVERALGLTFLGIIPTAAPAAQKKKEQLSEQQRDLYVFEHQRSQLAECARQIRTNLTFMGADKPVKCLLVVSAKPEEGKTSTAITLATTLALSGHKTLLVDTDMRRPRLHKVFGVGSEIGMSSYLLGERPLTDVLKRTVVPGLDVLPCGPIPPAPAELLHTAAFASLVEELKKRYDRIIFDSPPIIAVADAPILSAQADGVVFVVKAGATAKDIVKQGIAQMRSAHAHVLGAVLNNVDLSSRAYGYYYAYYRQYGLYAEDKQG
jgi:capsular exopolysaccharide synthesis family protein